MRYGVTLASEAKRDLREICRYIAAGPQSEPNANGQLNRLEKNILKLDEMPERFRVMSVDNSLGFYISNHQEKTVTVLRVMYGGQDIDAQLRNALR